ncbi:MAG: Abi family protein, partial [Alphaproteobacteria bacterium]|nr:Abi family protein [Alphaproteobacteria bacterium]
NFTKKRSDGTSLYSEWLDDYNKLLKQANRKSFVSHNIRIYGELPIWVAIEIFTFGTMSKLYSGLQIKDKIKIESQFGLNNGTEFQTWLRGLNFIRNTAAHHSRLWNCNVMDTASIPLSNVKLRQLKTSRPFLYFCLMQIILKKICPHTDWTNQFFAAMDEFPHPQNAAISIEDMGVVTGWKDWNIWK